VHWKKRVVITPFSSDGWDVKERVLQRVVNLIPADLTNLQLLLPWLKNADETVIAGGGIVNEYQCRGVDFTDPGELRNYVNDEFQFQLVCAICVHPKLKWEVVIELAHSLKKEHYPGARLDYSLFLKLARIRWIGAGMIPESVRLSLLKLLTPVNEKTARQAIIRLMDEAALAVKKDSFAYEEMVMQLITNKYILYLHDQTTFKEYEKEFETYKILLDANKVTDYPLITYLSKDNGNGYWNTLINNKLLSPAPEDSKSIIPANITDRKKMKKFERILLTGSIISVSYIVIGSILQNAAMTFFSLFIWSLLLMPMTMSESDAENP
jgi:hypothetical protein